LADQKSVKSRVAYLTKKNKNRHVTESDLSAWYDTKNIILLGNFKKDFKGKQFNTFQWSTQSLKHKLFYADSTITNPQT